MKRILISVLLSLLLILSCACAQSAAPAAAAPAAPAPAGSEPASEPAAEPEPEQGEMPPYAASISIETVDEEMKADDGTIVLHVSGAFPHVTVDDKEPATALISRYFEEKVNDFLKGGDESVAVVFEFAKEDYAERGAEMMPYEIALTYTVARADKTCLSFIEDEYSFTGGAHPNAAREAVTFDTSTGKELEFEDIVTDEDAARAFVEAQFTKYLEENDYGVFEDYKEHVSEILEDDTWYFDELGVVIICNEYIVAPHAAGIIEMTIPYAEFPQLKTEYSIAK